MKFYLGGYYLIRLKPQKSGNIIYTCSGCFNDNLVDCWAYTWTNNNDEQAALAKENFQLSDSQIQSIRTWVDKKHTENKLGWLNVFTDLETALEYKNSFFSHINDIKIIALYFNDIERNDILNEFKPQNEKMGEIGLRLTLQKKLKKERMSYFWVLTI